MTYWKLVNCPVTQNSNYPILIKTPLPWYLDAAFPVRAPESTELRKAETAWDVQKGKTWVPFAKAHEKPQSYRFPILSTPWQQPVWVWKRVWKSTALCHHQWRCHHWCSPSLQSKDQGCRRCTGVHPTGGLTLCVGVNSCKISPLEDKELQCRRLPMPSWLSPPQCLQSSLSQFSPSAFRSQQPFKKQPLKHDCRHL